MTVSPGERAVIWAAVGVLRCAKRSRVVDVARAAAKSILAPFFPDGIAPLGLFLGALPATVLMILAFLLAR